MSERRFRRTPGGVCSLGLHVVWCPKYRRRILGGRVARRLSELLEQIADEHGWQIVAKEVIPDHVHLFVRVGPTDAPAQVVRAFKGRTARVLRCEFPYLRNHAKVLWSPSYFAASVGYVSELMVRRDIEHQWDAVMVS
jgi:putative transposase